MKWLSKVYVWTLLSLLPAWAFGQKTDLCGDLAGTDPQYGYQARGNRCEGFYKGNVTEVVPYLELVQCIQAPFDYLFSPEEVIYVNTPIVVGPNISLLGMGINPSTFYRMNAELEGSNPLNWPLGEVLFANNLEPADVGLLGYYYRRGQVHFVPLQVRSKLRNTATRPSAKAHLSFRPSVKVDEFYYRVLQNGAVQIDFTKVPSTTGFPARQEIPMTLPQSLAAGTYRLEIHYKVASQGDFLLWDTYVTLP